jgi:hypothetical protein
MTDRFEFEFRCYQETTLGPTQSPAKFLTKFFPPKGRCCQDMKLTIHLQLVPRSRKGGSIHSVLIYLHDAVLNSLSTNNSESLKSVIYTVCKIEVFTVTFLRSVFQLLVTADVPRSLILFTLMMEATRSSEASVLKGPYGSNHNRRPDVDLLLASYQ